MQVGYLPPPGQPYPRGWQHKVVLKRTKVEASILFYPEWPSRFSYQSIRPENQQPRIRPRTSPSEKQSRGWTSLPFRKKKEKTLKTPPVSFSSRTSGTSKQHPLNPSGSTGSSSFGATTGALNQTSTSPSLKSKLSATSMTSQSESDFSPNDDASRPGVLGVENHIRKLVPKSPTEERKRKKKLKGAEKVLSIFS